MNHAPCTCRPNYHFVRILRSNNLKAKTFAGKLYDFANNLGENKEQEGKCRVPLRGCHVWSVSLV